MQVAITGGIGTGKSSLTSALRIHLPVGYRFYSFDDEIRSLYERDDVRHGLIQLFGTCVRSEISNLVFNDTHKLNQLESFFDPYVQDFIEGWLKFDDIVVEFPLLFEYGYDGSFEFIVAVVCDDRVKIERVQKRNGFGEEKIKRIIERQAPSSFFPEHANLVIDTTDNPNLGGVARKLALQIQGKKRGVVAGSFDPITEGHLWLIEKALTVVDVVDIVIAQNPAKKGLFDLESRAALVERSMVDLGIDQMHWQVNVLPKAQLMIKYAEDTGASFVFRGIRNVTDFDYESQINIVQKKISPGIETIFLMPPAHLTEVSSSLVKSLLYLEGWEKIVTQYVPTPVLNGLRAKQT